MRRPIKDQISELETQLQQKKARLEQLRRREAQEARKRDTRLKILAGAVVLKAADQDPEFAAQLRARLNRGLTAPRDRAMFGFPPLPEPPPGDGDPSPSPAVELKMGS